jgi:hypothetical protein
MLGYLRGAGGRRARFLRVSTLRPGAGVLASALTNLLAPVLSFGARRTQPAHAEGPHLAGPRSLMDTARSYFVRLDVLAALLACASHASRFLRGLLLHAFNARANFCAAVNGLGAV